MCHIYWIMCVDVFIQISSLTCVIFCLERSFKTIILIEFCNKFGFLPAYVNFAQFLEIFSFLHYYSLFKFFSTNLSKISVSYWLL